MKTPFGNAKINNHGYYYISTGNEYNNQLLHTLLFMKYWRTDIPEGYVIHHKDGNRTDLNKLEKEVKRQGYPWKKIEGTNNV